MNSFIKENDVDGSWWISSQNLWEMVTSLLLVIMDYSSEIYGVLVNWCLKILWYVTKWPSVISLITVRFIWLKILYIFVQGCILFFWASLPSALTNKSVVNFMESSPLFFFALWAWYSRYSQSFSTRFNIVYYSVVL